MYENTWNSTRMHIFVVENHQKYMKTHEILWNLMNIQENTFSHTKKQKRKSDTQQGSSTGRAGSSTVERGSSRRRAWSSTVEQDHQKCLKIIENVEKSTKMYENTWKLTRMHKNVWESTKNLWKHIKNNENA